MPKLQSPISNLTSRLDPHLLLVVLLSAFAAGPLMLPGYFWGAHDARHNVYFLFEFDRAIRDGILYPRWAPDFTFGYGYPFFNIYGPLATAIGEAFHLAGFDFVASVKLVFALAIVLSGVGMYLFVRRLMGPRAGLLAGLVYVYLPYHVFDLYVRAALAESLAYAWLPFVLWAFYETAHDPRLANVVGAGLAYAALMFTSNLVALLFSLVLGLYLIVLVVARMNREQPFRWLSKESLFPLIGNALNVSLPPLMGLLLGLGLSAIFWLPALTEFEYVRVDQWYAGRYAYRDYFVDFFQLFSPHWGFGAAQPGPHDDVSLQLGIVPAVLAVLSLAVLRRAKDPGLRRQLVFFQAMTVACVVLMLPVSQPLWEGFGPVRFAQFPWRYLLLAAVSMSILSGSVLHDQEGDDAPRTTFHASRLTFHASRLTFHALITLIILTLFASYPYIRAEIVPPAEGPVSLAGLMRFQQGADEMTGSTAWVQDIPTWSAMADYYIAGEPLHSKVNYDNIVEAGGVAVTQESGTTFERVEYKMPTDFRLTVNIFYYPGWKAYFVTPTETPDEPWDIIREVPIIPEGKLGLLSVNVPAGRHAVLFRFEDTPVRVVGKWLTLISLALVVLAVRVAMRTF